MEATTSDKISILLQKTFAFCVFSQFVESMQQICTKNSFGWINVTVVNITWQISCFFGVKVLKLNSKELLVTISSITFIKAVKHTITSVWETLRHKSRDVLLASLCHQLAFGKQEIWSHTSWNKWACRIAVSSRQPSFFCNVYSLTLEPCAQVEANTDEGNEPNLHLICCKHLPDFHPQKHRQIWQMAVYFCPEYANIRSWAHQN